MGCPFADIQRPAQQKKERSREKAPELLELPSRTLIPKILKTIR